MSTLDHANAARLQKALDRQYNYYDEGILTLRQWLLRHQAEITHKQTETTRKVTQLWSSRLGVDYPDQVKEATTYWLRYNDGYSLGVPKIVWDTFDLPVIVKPPDVTTERRYIGY